MNETYTPLAELSAIRPGPEAAHLGTAMYERIIVELRRLSAADWDAVTVCAPWSVTDIVRHLVGAAKGHASLVEFGRQAIHGARHKSQFGGNEMDAMNDRQVRDHVHLGPQQLIAELEGIAPRAVAKRMSRPAVLRRVKVPTAPGGSTAAGMPQSVTMGHLFDVILTRDVFLHRIDIARAVGRTVEMDAAVEGRLITDVVIEWAARHGSPFRLRLDGPAGGRYAAGADGPQLGLDAIEFCWILSGRGTATHPLLETRVLF